MIPTRHPVEGLEVEHHAVAAHPAAPHLVVPRRLARLQVQHVAVRGAALFLACLRLRRNSSRSFTLRFSISSAEKRTSRMSTAWTTSSASKRFPSLLPTRASGTAEHSASLTAATGQWLLSHGSTGNSKAMR